MSDHDAHYVEGDINQVDAADADDEFDDELEDEFDDADDDADDDAPSEAPHDERVGDDEEAALSTAVLTHIATSLAEDPSAVSIATEARGRRVTLRLSVAQQDMGRVIGRRGRTAQAIRALVAAAGAKEGLTTSVDIVD